MDNRKDSTSRDRIDDLKEEFSQQFEAISAAYHKFEVRTTRILIGIVVLLLVGGVVSIYLLNQNSQRSDEIQSQRYSSVLESCVGQNRRHDQTIRELNLLIAKLPNNREKIRAQKNEQGTISLINALAPKQNCTALALRVVHPPHKAP